MRVGAEEGRDEGREGAEFRKVSEPHNGPSKTADPTFTRSRDRKYGMKEGKQEALRGIARNGNKQWIIQVWQEEERLQKNQAALLAPRELKGNN